MSENSIQKIESKVRNQLLSQKVGFLLGAGSSYLAGAGYPLASQLWDQISDDIPPTERTEIQDKLDGGALGIEHALDLLDKGEVQEQPHRHSVVTAIANHFSGLTPPTAKHQEFVSLLARRNEQSPIKIFSLNYDPLLEVAAELESVRLFDGFHGHNCAFFDPTSFQHTLVMRGRTFRGRRTREVSGSLRLFKLHGSMGWYMDDELGIRRCGFTNPIPAQAKRLMIPPQYRKAQDTGKAPYSSLWSEFRSSLIYGDDPLMRLVALGYGMADQHVNVEIESALARPNFSLLILTKELSDDAFQAWSGRERVQIVTEARSSIDKEIGPGHPDLSVFEGFIEGLKQW